MNETGPGRGAGNATHKGLLALAVLAVLVLGGAYLWSHSRAVPKRMLNVGALQLTDVDVTTFEGFKARMRDMGYVEGETVHYHLWSAAGNVRGLDPLVSELLAAKVDLVFVSSTPATLAVKRATAGLPTLPVVFAPVNDPVGAGIVADLRSPGGNLTGVRLPQGDGLRLQWLLRLAPAVKRVLIPHNPQDKSAAESLNQARQAAALLGVEVVTQPVADPSAIKRELRHWMRDVDAIFLPRDSMIESQVSDFVEAARARRMPLCAPSLAQVEAGALLSYGFAHREIGAQAARIAGQILRGVPPADLPVETAHSYLALNLKTAQAIGIHPTDDILRQVQVLVR